MIVLLFLGWFSVISADNTVNPKRSNDNKTILTGYVLPEVVVTATKTKEKVSDLSSSISLITEKDIKLMNAFVAPDLLSNIPGITIMKTGNFGRSDIVIRGIGANGRRLAVLVDGRPEKMSIFNCAITHTLPLHNVKRIEVVKGPLSSLYGSGAMGGVVNILTHKPPDKTEVQISSDYGSNNTYNLIGTIGSKIPMLRMQGTVQKNSSDGYLENSSSSNEDYQGNFLFEPNKILNIKGYYKYTNAYKEVPAKVGETIPSNEWQIYRRGSLDFSISGRMKGLTSSIKFYRTFGHHILSDGWNSRDWITGVSLQAKIFSLNQNKTIIGTDYQKQYGNWVSHGEWERNIYAGFLHTEQKTDVINISTGLRYTYDTDTKSEFSYDGGVVLKLNDTRLRIKAGKGFRVPSMSDLYLFPISNSNLKPEKLYDYELGIGQKFLQWIKLDLSTYYMYTNNFIRFSPASGNFQNVDTLVEKGGEITASLYPLEGLSIQMGYSYIDRGEKTQGIPGQMISGNVTMKSGIFSVRIFGRYVSDYYASDNKQDPIPSYGLINFHLNVMPGSNLTLSLGVDNLLNRDYSKYVDIPGNDAGLYKMPGRTFKIGVMLKK